MTHARLDCNRVLQDAQGKWYGLLRHFGIDPGDGKHRPCPVCGGSDRFRYDDKGGSGSWICNQCGAGDGLKLLMNITGMGFVEACEEVAKVVGSVDKVDVQPEAKASREKLHEMFTASQPMKVGDPVYKYLQNRGLSKMPEGLRYGKCWEYETKQNQDAMLAVFSLPDGEAVTIHRTFIKNGAKLDVEAPRKVMPPLKKMTGGAVRLYPQGEMLGVTEGIETAIAVHQMYDIPVWAALSASLMESFEPPAWAKVVEVFADNDLNHTGAKAAYVLANKLALQGRVVSVNVAKNGDFLDDLVARG